MNQNSLSFLPKAPEYIYPWHKIRTGQFGSLILKMENTLQNSLYHKEGSVWTHTKSVCDTLSGMKEFRSLAPIQQEAVSLAALFHDIGKLFSTRLENGEWISPGHSLTGAHRIREILWKDFGMCGSAEKAAFREAVCMLIRYHSTPVYIHNHTEPENRLLKIASNGMLAPLFSLKLTCLLAEANIRGRICENQAEMLEKIEMCRELAAKAGCYVAPSSDKNGSENPMLHAAQCSCAPSPRVVLLCGLPGSGKDNWIRAQETNDSVISMDVIRKKLNLPKTESTALVSRTAQDEARALLHAGKGFIWNATNLSETTRMRLIRQFETLGAKIEIVYLETDWQKTMQYSEEKPESVPIPVLDEMLSKLTPPERFEAPKVRWVFS